MLSMNNDQCRSSQCMQWTMDNDQNGQCSFFHYRQLQIKGDTAFLFCIKQLRLLRKTTKNGTTRSRNSVSRLIWYAKDKRNDWISPNSLAQPSLLLISLLIDCKESLMVYKTYNMIGSQGDAIIGPMGPNAFAMHNLAPRRIRHFCSHDQFTRMAILHLSVATYTNV